MTRLTLVRRIAARPSIVFEAMTTAEGIAAWWGPEDLPVIRAEIDARVGGSYRIRFQTLDGGVHEVHGEYLELVPPRRIVMTWYYESGGELDERGRTSRIEIELAAIASGTELTLTHSGLATDASQNSHTWGWTGALDKLVRHMERGAGTATTAIVAGAIVLASLLTGVGAAGAEPAKARYPSMAPVEQYRVKSIADEVALARSAAPPSISADAEVLVLGNRGYQSAVKGKNGFVCFVERSWAAGFDDPEFWNPRLRSPNCFNAVAARTELPQLLKRTEWVLAGVSREQMIEKTRAAVADHSFQNPEPGALSFMLSKSGYITDEVAGPWLPHVMFFLPHGQAAAWGAGLEGSPVIGREGSELESTVLFVPVRRWSDGSPAPAPPEPHTHTK